MIRETLSSHHGQGSDFNGSASGNYVAIIIPATSSSKSRDHFGWTPPFEQAQDQESDSFDVLAPKKTGSTQTNNWTVSSDKDSTGFSKEGSFSKDTPWAQPDHGFAQFSTEESLKSTDQNDGWLSRRFDQHSSAHDWSRGFGSSQRKDPVRSAYEGYGQSKEDSGSFGAFNRQPFGAFSQSDEGNSDGAMRMPSAVSKTSLSDWSSESLRSQSEQQQLQMQPSIAETYDQLPTAARPFVRSSARDQSDSTQRQAPSAPAVLPFPQRPGSLFQ
ncbi:MAG TPA: hypothetical protein VGO67_15395 [Verrucomicrobiae bacterium]